MMAADVTILIEIQMREGMQTGSWIEASEAASRVASACRPRRGHDARHRLKWLPFSALRWDKAGTETLVRMAKAAGKAKASD
jgi:hypothetical protein